MKTFLHILIFSVYSFTVYSQEVSFITALDDIVQETSGLIYLQNRIITHNDSGNDPALYEIDSTSGAVTRKVLIANADNTDWEDICFDQDYIYIGDIGNNSGSRKDLKVYKIKISDYFQTRTDTVYADTIQFSYADQTDFSPEDQITNFDAEALISIKDQLYIFSKNWIDYQTDVYQLSKVPGKYELSRIDVFDTDGLITGGTYDPESDVILLTGYTIIVPFIIQLSDFGDDLFSKGNIQKTMLQFGSGNSVQLEAIAHCGSRQYLLSTEKNITGRSSLHLLNTSNPTGFAALIQNSTKMIYPNPANDYIVFMSQEYGMVQIYSINGKLMKTTSGKRIDVSNLDKGIYHVSVRDQEGSMIHNQLLVVE